MDTIAETINRIKIAGKAGKPTAVVPFSGMIIAVLEVLKREGYVKDFAKKGKKVVKAIEVEIAYEGGEPKVSGVERVSKPSRRIYGKASTLRSVQQGYGHLIITTPKGVMTEKEARTAKVGGELLFKIW